MYGFDIRYKQKEGIQEVHYIAGYATGLNSDLLSLSAGGRHGAKSYFGAQFMVSAYRFENKFDQTIVSFDPIVGYKFKRIFIEGGVRARIINFGEATQVKSVPFLTVGLR